MKRLVVVLWALMFAVTASAQRDSLLVVFWNVENFFDWKDGGTSDSERSFSCAGDRHWTRKRFYIKCNAISKTLMMIADSHGRLPDAVGFAEVENAFVLRQLVNSTLLRKAGYSIVHSDSPDPRGIDCGLLYRNTSLVLEDSAPCHLYDSTGHVIPTRDILLARFQNIAILVNHHPSKLGGSSSERRTVALDRMNAVMDSLVASGCPRVLSVGDFNDTLWDRAEASDANGQTDSSHMSPPAYKKTYGGTIKFNGAWEKIDGHFSRGVSVHESVWDSPLLCTTDRQFGGVKPLRTYSGPRWLGGTSDHFPIVLWVYY